MLMGYFYLFLALTGGLVKGFTGKRVSKDVHTLKDCFFVNFLRVFFCGLISTGFLLTETGGALSLPAGKHLLFYCFSALSMAAFCVVFMFGYKTAAYMYLSIFGMLGSVMTGILGSLVYDEALGWNKLLGMAALLAAVVVMSKYNQTVTQVRTRKVLPLLCLAAVSATLSDFSQKIFVYEIGESAATYNFYTYGLSALMLLPAFLLAKGSLGKENAPLLQGRHFLLCFVIAASLFLNSYSKTLAAGFLTAAEIYPVLQGANLIASALLARLLLKETITPRCVVGMIIAFAGVMIMNL